MTDNLVAWLGKQIDEDEAIARNARPGPWELKWNGQEHELWSPDEEWPIAEWTYAINPRGERGEIERAECDTGTQEHIARHDPARALREVAAKRRMIAAHHPYVDEPDQACLGCAGGLIWGRCPILRALASIYTDRPGYRDEWA